MIMSHHQNSGQNQNIRIANESLEKVTKFKYLGTTLTNQNDIHDEIKSRLNSGNACYYSVQNLLSPLASDALLTTLHSLLENVLQTVDHFEISCLGSLLFMGRDLNWILCSARKKVDRWNPIRTSASQSKSRPRAICGLFQKCEARNFEVINGLQHVFEKWVERCLKCIACQGRCFEKETVTASQSNKLSPRTVFGMFEFYVTVTMFFSFSHILWEAVAWNSTSRPPS
jgi:hypothetical protein